MSSVLAVQITEQLAGHPDHEIVQSLPRPGIVRATRLLSEIGDCRGRFSIPELTTGELSPSQPNHAVAP